MNENRCEEKQEGSMPFIQKARRSGISLNGPPCVWGGNIGLNINLANNFTYEVFIESLHAALVVSLSPFVA